MGESKKIHVATISMNFDKDQNEIRTTLEGSKDCKLSLVAENLFGILQGMAELLAINPDAVLGGFENQEKQEVDNG